MARNADTTKTIITTADDLHTHDRLHGKDGVLNVEKVSKRDGKVTITLWRGATPTALWHGASYTVAKDRLVKVSTEHECDCKGSGTYSWGGSVNGIPLHTGEHFACHGKGWQDRSDVIRNATYWNKYARLSA